MTVINLPLDETKVQLSQTDDSVFWKQIIPMDRKIVYGGQSMTFSRPLLDQIKGNYDAHIMDQTAFQLADDENRHDTPEDIAKERNWDPERYRGDVQEVQVRDSGLWGKFKLTEEGLKLIKNNPNLGVSASIKPKWADETGKEHKWVLRHVAGTLNPKIKKMSPWQRESITLSATDEDNEEVFDLTTTEPAPTKTEDETKVSVDKAEYEKMQKSIADFADGEKLLDDILMEADEEVEPTNLSDAPAKDPAITALENKVAASDWRAEKKDYVTAGVPMSMLNLCDDIMSISEVPTINLSDDSEIDPRDTIRKMLDQAKGYIDLADEDGHGKTPDERKTEADAAKAFANGFINEYINPIF